MEEELLQKPLAFSASPNLVHASARISFQSEDGVLLNVEIFADEETKDSPILLAVHGVCESIETLGIQAIVAGARQRHVRVACLELSGHGLSSGKRCVCSSFEKILDHVLQFVKFAVPKMRNNDEVPYFLTGSSLGGSLCAYASQHISTNVADYPNHFNGVALLAPAVGVDAAVVPPSPVVQCLRLMSCIAPSAQTPFTPYEDSTHYNCPENTNRNFSGHWPLATSKMLLDVTSNTIPNDIMEGKLSLENVGAVVVIVGEKDNVVPLEAVEKFYNGVNATKKELVRIKNAGHDLMFRNSSSDVAVQKIFDMITSNT
ncbi:hypothetical protein CTEN210_15610 [Chaetoceros tenuissimus]|uniref:Serine aminopeptidase S33 domain-containing protein n=1 Tax=Chaetoceros tenuissimus TaxID=426638 RepID=A0AAD3HDE7_9STRA|nr:hypothetical protein CTEN210_15610 [Chaetoceros tenuissimus]